MAIYLFIKVHNRSESLCYSFFQLLLEKGELLQGSTFQPGECNCIYFLAENLFYKGEIRMWEGSCFISMINFPLGLQLFVSLTLVLT
jgi:hypothetical protein